MNALDHDDVERFITDGYVCLRGAFPSEIARQCVHELSAAANVDLDAPDTWHAPVVRLLGSAAAPLVAAINSPRLVAALDELLHPGRWQRRTGYGSFAIRFPSEHDPGDTGWHVDGSYEVGDRPPPWNYHLNFWSRGRALLLLMLFSDVGPHDAPTRIRVGSHLDVTGLLRVYGPVGAPFDEISSACAEVRMHPVVQATGDAGDVYLCHPFLLHAATWPHRGTAPRFLGQPAIHHAPAHDGFDYDRPDPSAPEIAVSRAIERERHAAMAASRTSEQQ